MKIGNINTMASKKERFFGFMIIVSTSLIYLGINKLVSLSAPHPSIAMAWETHIPFIPEFIIFYHSMSLALIVLFSLPHSRIALYTLVIRLIFVYVVSYVVFLLFPLQFGFDRPEIEGGIFLHYMFSILEDIDLPYNQFPSLHISSFVVYWFSIKQHLQHRYLKILTAIWFLLVIVSVLFVYQHHFLDVVSGIGVGLTVVWLCSDSWVQKVCKIK